MRSTTKNATVKYISPQRCLKTANSNIAFLSTRVIKHYISIKTDHQIFLGTELMPAFGCRSHVMRVSWSSHCSQMFKNWFEKTHIISEIVDFNSGKMTFNESWIESEVVVGIFNGLLRLNFANLARLATALPWLRGWVVRRVRKTGHKAKNFQPIMKSQQSSSILWLADL